MALVTCPDCGKQISDAAPACIHCGRPTASGVHKPNDKPIVIMGTGIPAVCAIINKLVDIAYNAPDKGPVVYVFVLDTRDQPKPDAATRYPLNGISTDAMHPFKPAKPPEGFPTLGQYAREMAEADASWNVAVRAPTYRHVSDWLEFLLELSVRTVSDKAYIDSSNKPIGSIEQIFENGPARISFLDFTSLEAKQIIRAGRPPHMGGVTA